MTNKITEIINLLKTISLLELNNLIKEIENNFSINVSTNSNFNNNIQNNIKTDILSNDIEEKNTFDIILESVPMEKKINVLKIIRNITGLGLKESKNIVDNTPQIIKENINKEELDKIVKELELAGAIIKIK